MKKGDLVRFESKDYFTDDALPVTVWKTGVIVDISESTDIFSEKYAIMETTTYIQILSDGKLEALELAQRSSLPEAIHLLESERYQLLKEQYRQGMQRFGAAISADLVSHIESARAVHRLGLA